MRFSDYRGTLPDNETTWYGNLVTVWVVLLLLLLVGAVGKASLLRKSLLRPSGHAERPGAGPRQIRAGVGGSGTSRPIMPTVYLSWAMPRVRATLSW